MGNICKSLDLCTNNTSMKGSNSIVIENSNSQNIIKINNLNHLSINNNTNQFGLLADTFIGTVSNNDKNNLNYIDSYNANNNFFYYLKHISLIQKKYREYLQRKLNVYIKEKEKEEKKNIKDSNRLNEPEKELTLNNNFHLTRRPIFTKTFSIGLKGEMVDKTIRGNFLNKKNMKTNFIGYASNYNSELEKGFGQVIWEDGSVLKGNFDNSIINGISLFQDKTDGVYSGEYKRNIPNGYGIYSNGGIILEGQWNGNQLNGIGIEISEDETIYEGTFKNCMKDGIGRFKWSDGTIYKGEWVDNTMMGYGMIIYQDNSMYIGGIKEGKIQGYGEFFFKEEGKRFFGFYEKEKRNGFGCYVWSTEPLEAFYGLWKDGKMDGPGIKISNNMFKYGIWREGKKIKWLSGSWDLNSSNFSLEAKYLPMLKKTENKIIEFINKTIER